MHIGDRSAKSAQALWQSLPSIYRQGAAVYSDFWSADADLLPSTRHQAVGKETGKTSDIERFNCTLCQTSSFSKKLENHIGVIWLFIRHDNAALPIRSSFPV